jgi:hypothetical protein
VEELSAYVGCHAFAEWWVVPNDVSFPLAGFVGGIVVYLVVVVWLHPAYSSACWYGSVVALNWSSSLGMLDSL